MAKQEALIAEYNTLRQEILQMIQMNLQFKGAAFAVAAGFIVYGFQSQNSIAFIASDVILITTLYYNARSIKGLLRIGAYIHSLIEPNLEGLRWETINLEIRKREIRRRSIHTQLPIISLFMLINLGCLFFIWWFLKNYLIINIILYSCITLILIASFVAVSVSNTYYASEKYYSICVSYWKKIEKEIYDTPTSIKTNTGKKLDKGIKAN